MQEGPQKKSRTLYVSDMDGTLLDETSRISPETARVLNDVVGCGALFTVATARTPATVDPLLSAVRPSVAVDASTGGGVEVPAIVMTGSGLWSRADRRFVDISFVSEADATKIAMTFEREGLRPFIYCLGEGAFLNVYHPSAMSRREDAFYQERRYLELKRFHLDQHPSRFDRVVLFFATGPTEKVSAVCSELQGVTDCAVAWYPDIAIPDTGLVDIYAPGVSKASAVRGLADRVGADRIVVFGDNLNDLPMMKVADVAVAVENALPQVREVADIVIGPNTEASVARFIASDFGR